MMGGGGGELHQQLKNLCLNTDWKYAVFWKLKHQPQMVLTWEDAYCYNNEKTDRSGSNWFDNMDEDTKHEECARDVLGLAVAKMFYHIYPIGEGIVGQVAARGKHLWISGHQLVKSLCCSHEHFDGWKTQFKAGIRTIALVSVFPYGVVQLGSLNTITEDLKLVNHVRAIFFELQSSLMVSMDCSPCVTDLSTSSNSVRRHRYVNDKDRNRSNMWSTDETINNHQESENLVSDFVQSALTDDQFWNLFTTRNSNDQTLNNLAAYLEFKTETDESFKFPGGFELYEALGPGFCKQKSSFDWETVTTETLTVDEMPGEMSSSDLLSQRSASEHLLEAVVANICCSDTDDKGSTSFGQSVKPSWLQPSPGDLPACYSFERSFHEMTTNLQACSSSQGFSSTSVSRHNKQIERSQEPAKVGKKRARPGESGRPRPRDRQLIQDRIKELRQLVPNGSKCSIDSLLERTIKHMLFMQCLTKHADKIDKCAEFKLLGKKKGIQGSYVHEQGSSWAMEVGNHPKICPIIVENIGVDGQMLVEMMSDECVQFLEMTEAIRSLGLTILKGVTDAYGDKTWMCFVVEGENDKSMHRMDILWSLVQMLQLKTKT